MNKLYVSIIILSLSIFNITSVPDNNSLSGTEKRVDENIEACAAYRDMLAQEVFYWTQPTEDYDTAHDDINQTKNYSFSCIDIDYDGINELIVENPNGCTAEPMYKIFAYKNGEVKNIFASNEMEIYNKEGIVVDKGCRMGGLWEYVYKIDEGNAEIIAGLNAVEPDYWKMYYRDINEKIFGFTNAYSSWWVINMLEIKGEEVNYLEYLKVKNRINGYGKREIQYYPNTSEEREKYIK